MITIQEEDFMQCKDELFDISERYFNEVQRPLGDNQSYLPDKELFEEAAKKGSMKVVCMRKENSVVGFSIIVLSRDSSNINSTVSQAICLYVDKAYRGKNSLFLMMKVEQLAKLSGANYHIWVVEPSNDYSAYLSRVGYKPKETLHMKYLGG